MIVKALVENTAISDEYRCEHGLCLYIETKAHKLLYDLGQSDFFIENASKMNINLEEVDTAIISHGHYDHGGGLKAFLKINSKAKVYIHSYAFEKYYSMREQDEFAYIGLDESIATSERIIFNSGYLKIDDELELISEITDKELIPTSNKHLFARKGNSMQGDFFEHEQSLVITEDEKMVLIAGCAHKGIVNIVSKATRQKGRKMDYVIGGFHLYNPRNKTTESPEFIRNIAEKLKNTGTMYYTCHCTGLEAYSRLKEIMDKNIEYLSSGSSIEI